MESIYTVPQDLVFHPCPVDGGFWSALSGLLVWLSDPEQLAEVYRDNPKQYFEIIEPFQRFISTTESDLKAMGKLKEEKIKGTN